MTIKVLGVDYEIIESNREDDNNLEDADGYCDFSVKKIVIDTFKNRPGSMEDLTEYKKQVLRHELIHAFLHESGLYANSGLDCNSVLKDGRSFWKSGCTMMKKGGERRCLILLRGGKRSSES